MSADRIARDQTMVRRYRSGGGASRSLASAWARAVESLQVVARRPRHVLLAAVAAGLALSASPLELILSVGSATLAVLTLVRRPRLALLVVAGLLAAWCVGHARLDAIDGLGRGLGPGDRVAGTAHLLTPPRPGRFGSSAELRMTSGRARGARLLGRFGQQMRLPPGADPGIELRLTGSVCGTRPARPGRFDLQAYLRRRGAVGELEVTSVRSTRGRRGGLAGAIDTARLHAEKAIAAGLAPPSAALVRGMVLGQDEAVDPAVRDDFRASGLSHLLAVSGQNVMLLTALALPLLSAAGLPTGMRVVVAIGLIALYVPLAGAGPSLQRAGVMGAASLSAFGLARPASRWYALLLAACATLLLNPRACGDPGWQLSFAAVAGILALVPALRRGALGGLPHLLGEGIAITLAATLATAPLLAHHFGLVPIAGLPANILALPLVAPIMWLGMLRAGAGQMLPSGAGDTAPLGDGVAAAAGALNDALGAALGPPTAALSALARAFADVPGGQLAWRPSPALVLLGYAAIAVGALAVARLARRAEPSLTVAAAGWRRRPRQQRIVAVCVAAGLGALVLGRAVAPPDPPDRPTVSFLDVGQGDATLIQHPEGTAVLVDGGPPEGRAARLLRRSGVRRLSAIVMTHPSRDHHGGLLEVVEHYPVDLLVDGGDGTRDRSFRAVVAAAVARGARRVKAVAPLTLYAGAITIRVLSPAPRPAGPPPEDPNPRAVVAVVSIGEFDLLLSADAESPTLSGLRLPHVEAMKVPHHGSRDPGLPQILDRIRPAVASIPVGQNTYGHPAPSTLAALRAAGVSVHRNDREGTVRLTVEHGEVRVTTERREPVGAGP